MSVSYRGIIESVFARPVHCHSFFFFFMIYFLFLSFFFFLRERVKETRTKMETKKVGRAYLNFVASNKPADVI